MGGIAPGLNLLNRSGRLRKKTFTPWQVIFRRIIFPLNSYGFFWRLPLILVAQRAQPTTRVPDTPMWQRPLVSADALAFYIAKLVFPLSLGIDYSARQLEIAQHQRAYTGRGRSLRLWRLPQSIFVRRAGPWRCWVLLLFISALTIAGPGSD